MLCELSKKCIYKELTFLKQKKKEKVLISLLELKMNSSGFQFQSSLDKAIFRTWEESCSNLLYSNVYHFLPLSLFTLSFYYLVNVSFYIIEKCIDSKNQKYN